MTVGVWIALLYGLGLVPYIAIAAFGFLLASRDLRTLAPAAAVTALVVSAAHTAYGVIQMHLNHPGYVFRWPQILFGAGFDFVYWALIAVVAALLITYFRRRRLLRAGLQAPTVRA